MSGIGEKLSAVARLPAMALVLVRPPVAVPTGPVFKGLATKHGSPMQPLPAGLDLAAFTAWLSAQRNDLEAPAKQIAPPVADALAALAAMPDVGLARMSGSGATCFGLVADMVAADRVANQLSAAHPDWWVTAAPVLADHNDRPAVSITS
jgi:4-diphosphocytidyl-2-C-methyl-D-erythritol kinase